MDTASATIRASPQEMVRRLFLENIEAVARPELAPRLLQSALMRANREDIPDDPGELRWFVDGPLFDVLRDAFGPDDAESVFHNLIPLLPRVTDASGLRPEQRIDDEPQTLVRERGADPDESAEFLRLPAAGEASGLVVVCGRQPDRMDAVLRALTPDARGHRATDLMSLFDLLQDHPTSVPVIVLDCEHPALNPISLATLLPDMPMGAAIVLWGATRQEEGELLALAPQDGRFIRCPSDAPAAHVAMLAEAARGA